MCDKRLRVVEDRVWVRSKHNSPAVKREPARPRASRGRRGLGRARRATGERDRTSTLGPPRGRRDGDGPVGRGRASRSALKFPRRRPARTVWGCVGPTPGPREGPPPSGPVPRRPRPRQESRRRRLRSRLAPRWGRRRPGARPVGPRRWSGRSCAAALPPE